MLTIENYNRLKGKVIGNTGYYVSGILPVANVDTATTQKRSFYWIEITDRKHIVKIELDREGFATGRRMKLYELKLGRNYINLTKFQLRNIDVVVDKINQLVLEKYPNIC